MKYLVIGTLLVLNFSSCDPTVQMEANIENYTADYLAIVFASFDSSLNKTLQIAPFESVLFQEGYDVGTAYLEPSLSEYDSILIKNNSDEILKVYKYDTTGKNIFKVDEFWISSEPSRRFYSFNYRIRSEDFN